MPVLAVPPDTGVYPPDTGAAGCTFLFGALYEDAPISEMPLTEAVPVMLFAAGLPVAEVLFDEAPISEIPPIGETPPISDI